MRNTKVVTIDDKNRDQGKRFFLTEMSALRTEKWAMRAFLALASSGVEVPPDLQKQGMQGLLTIGIQALARGVDFYNAEPLLDELLECVQIMPNAVDPNVKRALVSDPLNPDGDDIQEVSTLLKLRAEVLNLHVDFSMAGVNPKSNSETTTNSSPA